MEFIPQKTRMILLFLFCFLLLITSCASFPIQDQRDYSSSLKSVNDMLNGCNTKTVDERPAICPWWRKEQVVNLPSPPKFHPLTNRIGILILIENETLQCAYWVISTGIKRLNQSESLCGDCHPKKTKPKSKWLQQKTRRHLWLSLFLFVHSKTCCFHPRYFWE